MKTEFLVRAASIGDAFEISKLVVLTINQSCFLDHNDDFKIIDKWVKNKTVTNFIEWINDSSLYLNVVLSDGRISGIGMCDSGSHISLCYVLPEFMRGGVGAAIIEDLESRLWARGLLQVNLVSTKTAYEFYKRLGYERSAADIVIKGVTGIPMSKKLKEVI